MQYRSDRNGEPISILGYGCMRFTKTGNKIDIKKAEQELTSAIEAGVNYFDTAYIYGGSEACLGEIFARNHVREKVNIATKLPHYLIRGSGGIERYFSEQLHRLQTSYIDYYLMHMLTDADTWEKLRRLGIESWIEQKKRDGVIRNIGFSFHGNTETFLPILEAYDWDFCQIQYNYMDEVSQAGRRGLQAAAAKGIPVIIMEPLRGGRLSSPPAKAAELIEKESKYRSPSELALRWLWNQPEVTCVLSGMNSVEMVRENCAVASDVKAGEFTAEDEALVARVRALINEKIKVPCTGCGYCMPCPKGVDIPTAFRCYNNIYTESRRSARKEYFQTAALRKESVYPSQCVGCGRCESHCPQGISIIEELKNANRELLPAPWRIAAAVGKKFIF